MRVFDVLVFALVLSVSLVAGCYQEPKGVRCSITCDNGETCPNGLSCNAGYCLAEGEAACVDPALPIKWKALAQGDSHRCAISADGALYCWGNNHTYQLGFGTGADVTPDKLPAQATPKRVDDSKTWTLVAAGARYTCGVRDQHILCWGDNQEGRAGAAPSILNVAAPRLIDPLPQHTNAFAAPSTVIDLQVGYLHACAILQSAADQTSTIWCWGNNRNFQTSAAVANSLAQPITVEQIHDWDKLYINGDRNCAHSKSPAVGHSGYYCWGANLFGNNLLPLTANHAPRELDLTPAVLPIREFAGSTFRSCVIDAMADLYCWGLGNYNGFGVEVTTIPGCETLGSACVVTAPRQVFPEQRGWTGVTITETATCAKDNLSRWRCFGLSANRDGASLPVGKLVYDLRDTLIDVTAVPRTAAMFLNANRPGGCAINDGAISCWGNNQYGQLGIGTFSQLAPTEVAPPVGTTWSKIRAARDTTCGIASDQHLYCWGDQGFGAATGSICRGIERLCVNATPTLTAQHNTPIKDVTLSATNICTLSINNEINCSGLSDSRGLGNDSTKPPLARRVTVPNAAIFDQLVGMNAMTCGRAIDGAPAWYCWGSVGGMFTYPNGIVAPLGIDLTAMVSSNQFAMFRDGSNAWYNLGVTENCPGCTSRLPWGVSSPNAQALANPTPLQFDAQGATITTMRTAEEGSFICGLDTNQKIWCWGLNTSGQVGVPIDPPGVEHGRVLAEISRLGASCSALSVGNSAACAVCEGGPRTGEPYVACWGSAEYGMLGKDALDTVAGDGYIPHVIPTPALANGDTWVDVVQGAKHACARSDAGRVACWGNSELGQGGTGGFNAYEPVPLTPVLP